MNGTISFNTTVKSSCASANKTITNSGNYTYRNSDKDRFEFLNNGPLSLDYLSIIGLKASQEVLWNLPLAIKLFRWILVIFIITK